jgi:hypothetical protein
MSQQWFSDKATRMEECFQVTLSQIGEFIIFKYFEIITK